MQAPTEVTDNPTTDGYITYTDTTGQYMEIKNVDALIYQNTKYTEVSHETKDGVTKYTFESDDSITNPAYPGQTYSISQIEISVTENADNHTQTIEIKIPAALIPLRVNTVKLDANGAVTKNDNNGTMPLRLCYEVGLDSSIDPVTLQGVSDDYIQANTKDGKVSFYSNYYDKNAVSAANKGVGATVTFEPSPSNPFYFIQEDTPLYVGGTEGVLGEGGDGKLGTLASGSIDSNETYYFEISYYDGKDTVHQVIARDGSSLATDGYTATDESGNLYIAKGAPRLGNLQDVTASKEDGSNNTGTYGNYREPTFVYDEGGSNPQKGHFVVLLGNNGKLQVDVPGTLTIAKNITADNGLTAPTDKAFTFDLTVPSKANTTDVKAVLHTNGADGQTITLSFDENGKAQVANADGTKSDITLKGGQSLEIPGMGNVQYTVVERNVANGAVNDGFKLTKVEGATGASSADNSNPTNDVSAATAAGTVDTSNATVTFTNTYAATGDLTLDGTKTLKGRDWIDGDDFTFTLTGKNVTQGAGENSGFTLPDPSEVKVDYNDAVDAAKAGGTDTTEGIAVPFSFGEITFSQAGTYEFTITESGYNDEPNVENTSGTAVTYTYTVADDGNGNLTAALDPAQASQAGTNAFVNTYKPGSATAGLTATKTVNGESKGIAADQFSFKIEAVSAPQGATASLPTNADDGTVKNSADGVIDFGTFTFSAEGDYVYKVTEVDGNSTGYSYDNTAYTVVFHVTDDPAEGKLITSSTIYKGTDEVKEIVFANTYHPVAAPATAEFSGTKSVTDEHGEFSMEAGQFSFTMTNTQAPAGVTAPTPSNESTVTNDDKGNFNFGTLTFTEPGEYTYAVSEVSPTGAYDAVKGITYDGTQYTLYFNVVDANGTLKVDDQTITSSRGGEVNPNALNFTNIYNDGEVSYQIAGTKVLDANGFSGASLSEGQFSFVLVENGEVVQTVKNDAPAGSSASFAFDPITYTEPGTHTYTVYEVGADGENGTGGTDNNNITYSKEAYTVKVTVSQAEGAAGEHGGLSVSADTQNKDIVFTNSYKPTEVTVGPSGDVQIGGTKTLDVADGSQRDMKEGEFTFLLLQGGEEVGRAANAADGSFVFDDITYDQVGTYLYTVSEVNDGLGGITYDATLYTVEVNVTENTDTHALEAAVTYHDNTDKEKPVEEMTFTNSYKASPASAALGVVKKLEGADLKDGQFTFRLTGSDGAPMPDKDTVTNAADGSVLFDTITFDSVGEYNYTITEINDGQNGIIYDENADRTIHVSVTDNGMGSLEAKVTYGGEGSVITNTAKATPPSGNDNGGNNSDTGSGSTGNKNVQTGDTAQVFPVAAVLLAALVVIIAVSVIMIRRRRK